MQPETRIAIENPRDEDVRRLLGRHLDFARRHSPPGDIHALEVDALLDPAITFYCLREDGALLAVGALKQLDATHGELKSMHTAEDARGRGLGRTMLRHLLDVARGRGLERVSLETGSMEAFAPARSLYASVGFEPCEPFGSYSSSRNSEFLTMTLEPAGSSGR